MMRLHAASLAALWLAFAGQSGAATLEALLVNPRGQAVMDAAVVLEPLAPVHAKNHATASIEQRGSEFIPYVTIAQTGTAIEFPNNDTTKHHVYSFSPAKRFEIKLYAGKPGQPVIFDKPGQVVIGCNIHDWMEAYVLIVDSPFFHTTAGDGRAVIQNIPAGRYRLQLWHPQQTSAQPPIEVEVGNSPVKMKLVMDVKPRERKPRTEGDPDRY
jgi:plastocyanin